MFILAGTVLAGILIGASYKGAFRQIKKLSKTQRAVNLIKKLEEASKKDNASVLIKGRAFNKADLEETFKGIELLNANEFRSKRENASKQIKNGAKLSRKTKKSISKRAEKKSNKVQKKNATISFANQFKI